MTLFSALGRKRLALLTIVFVIGVACAKVDREYDDIPSAGSGGADASGGKGGSATGGSGNSGGRSSGGAESAGEGGTTGDAGSAGESSAGAAGAAGGPDELLVPLTVTLAGNGSGSVKSLPAGIDCAHHLFDAGRPGQLGAAHRDASNGIRVCRLVRWRVHGHWRLHDHRQRGRISHRDLPLGDKTL